MAYKNQREFAVRKLPNDIFLYTAYTSLSMAYSKVIKKKNANYNLPLRDFACIHCSPQIANSITVNMAILVMVVIVLCELVSFSSDLRAMQV